MVRELASAAQEGVSVSSGAGPGTYWTCVDSGSADERAGTAGELLALLGCG